MEDNNITIKSEFPENVPEISEVSTTKKKPIKKYLCSICQIRFARYDSLKKHFEQMQHNLLCTNCIISRIPRKIDSMIEHLKISHNLFEQTAILECIKNQNLVKNEERSSAGRLYCLFCDRPFIKFASLYLHLSKVHHFCYSCLMSHDSFEEYDEHSTQHLKGEIKLYKCKGCALQFLSFRRLKNHFTTSHKNKKFEYCYDECLIESTTIPFADYNTCPYCLCKSRNKTATLDHITNHEKVECQDCHSYFITSPMQNSPIISQCHICEEKEILRIKKQKELAPEHKIRPHSHRNKSDPKIKKPFSPADLPCLFCDFRGSVQDINEHTSTHNYCRICNDLFKSDLIFNAHKQSHNRGLIKFNECILCNQSFVKLEDIKKHIISNHITNTSQSINYNEFIQKVVKTLPKENMDKLKDFTQCPYCYVYMAIDYQANHLLRVHTIDQCNRCFKFYKNVDIIASGTCNSCLDNLCIKAETITNEPSMDVDPLAIIQNIKSEPVDPDENINCDPDDVIPNIKCELIDPDENMQCETEGIEYVRREDVDTIHNGHSMPMFDTVFIKSEF